MREFDTCLLLLVLILKRFRHFIVFLVTFLHAFSWLCESLLHTSFGSHEAVCCTLPSGPMWQYVTHLFWSHEALVCYTVPYDIMWQYMWYYVAACYTPLWPCCTLRSTLMWQGFLFLFCFSGYVRQSVTRFFLVLWGGVRHTSL